MKHLANRDVISLFLSSSGINVKPTSDVTGSPFKLTTTGHDFTCPNTNCSGIEWFGCYSFGSTEYDIRIINDKSTRVVLTAKNLLDLIGL